MSLADTILRGTDQQASAAAGLVRVRRDNRENQRAAVEALDESAKDLGNTFKQFGDWSKAQKAEVDIREINNAEALGQTVKGVAGRMAAINAYRPGSAAGAAYAVKRRDQATEDMRHELDRDADEADIQLHKAQARDLDSKIKERDTKMAGVAKFKNSGELDRFIAGLGDDADPASVEALTKFMNGEIDEKVFKATQRTIEAGHKRKDALDKSVAKTAAQEEDTKTFDAARANFDMDTPVLDQATGAYRPPTTEDRLKRAGATTGVTPAHMRVIQADALSRRAEEGRNARQQAFLTQQANHVQRKAEADQLRSGIHDAQTAFGLDARTVLSQNKEMRLAAQAVVAEAERQLKQSEHQRLIVEFSDDLSDAQKQAKLSSLDMMDADAQATRDEFTALLGTIAKTGGTSPGHAPSGSGHVDLEPVEQRVVNGATYKKVDGKWVKAK